MADNAAQWQPIETPVFNAYAAYLREREYTRKVERTLGRSLALLSTECSRRELRGEDVAHIRAFIREASQ